jgi:hypothetical protein
MKQSATASPYAVGLIWRFAPPGTVLEDFEYLNGKWALEEFTTRKRISVQHKQPHDPFGLTA